MIRFQAISLLLIFSTLHPACTDKVPKQMQGDSASNHSNDDYNRKSTLDNGENNKLPKTSQSVLNVPISKVDSMTYLGSYEAHYYHGSGIIFKEDTIVSLNERIEMISSGSGGYINNNAYRIIEVTEGNAFFYNPFHAKMIEEVSVETLRPLQFHKLAIHDPVDLVGSTLGDIEFSRVRTPFVRTWSSDHYRPSPTWVIWDKSEKVYSMWKYSSQDSTSDKLASFKCGPDTLAGNSSFLLFEREDFIIFKSDPSWGVAIYLKDKDSVICLSDLRTGEDFIGFDGNNRFLYTNRKLIYQEGLFRISVRGHNQEILEEIDLGFPIDLGFQSTQRASYDYLSFFFDSEANTLFAAMFSFYNAEVYLFECKKILEE